MAAPTEYGTSEPASELRVQPATVASLLPDLFDRPRGDNLVELLHEARGLLEGHAHQVGDSYNHYDRYNDRGADHHLNDRGGDSDIDDDGDALEARRSPYAESISMIITTMAMVFIITMVTRPCSSSSS